MRVMLVSNLAVDQRFANGRAHPELVCFIGFEMMRMHKHVAGGQDSRTAFELVAWRHGVEAASPPRVLPGFDRAFRQRDEFVEERLAPGRRLHGHTASATTVTS